MILTRSDRRKLCIATGEPCDCIVQGVQEDKCMALVTTIRIDRLAELEAKERRLGLLENWTSPFLLRAFEKYMRNYEEAETVRSRQERDKRRP